MLFTFNWEKRDIDSPSRVERIIYSGSEKRNNNDKAVLVRASLHTNSIDYSASHRMIFPFFFWVKFMKAFRSSSGFKKAQFLLIIYWELAA